MRGESRPRKGQGSKTLCKRRRMVNNLNKYSSLAVRLWQNIEVLCLKLFQEKSREELSPSSQRYYFSCYKLHVCETIYSLGIFINNCFFLLHFSVGEKFRWFYENLEDGKEQYSCSEVCHLIERYDVGYW